MRRGSWDYSSDYYYLNEVNPEMLFAEENDQPLSAANDVLAVLLQNYYGNENADYDVDYVEVRGRARKRAGRTKNDLGAYKKGLSERDLLYQLQAEDRRTSGLYGDRAEDVDHG